MCTLMRGGEDEGKRKSEEGISDIKKLEKLKKIKKIEKIEKIEKGRGIKQKRVTHVNLFCSSSWT